MAVHIPAATFYLADDFSVKRNKNTCHWTTFYIHTSTKLNVYSSRQVISTEDYCRLNQQFMIFTCINMYYVYTCVFLVKLKECLQRRLKKDSDPQCLSESGPAVPRSLVPTKHSL